jgi:hypothetical protein
MFPEKVTDPIFIAGGSDCACAEIQQPRKNVSARESLVICLAIFIKGTASGQI